MGRCYHVNNRNNVLAANDIAQNNILAVNNSCNSCNQNGNCNREESMLDNLCNYLGCLCNCQFDVCNSRSLEEVNGILEEVGCDFIVLRSTNTGRRTICNTDNLQFVNII